MRHQLAQRLPVLGDRPQRGAFALRRGALRRQLQGLRRGGVEAERLGDQRLFTVRWRQLQAPLLVFRRVEAEGKGFAALELALHQYRLRAFKSQLVGAAVVGEGDGDGADQREQDEQRHAGDAGIHIAPHRRGGWRRRKARR